VRPQLCEELVCTTPRLAAEQVRQLARLLGALRALLLDRLRVDARGGDRVELGTDVDDAAEERLLALHLRLIARHRVERGARLLARRALDEAQVLGERAEL